MKEHGMLFKAEMVRAIMRPVDPKRQTRRPITFSNSTTGGMVCRKGWSELRWPEAILKTECIEGEQDVPFWNVPFHDITVNVYPRVMPGDRLWVKETWAAPHRYDHLPPRLIETIAAIYYSALHDLGGLMKRSSMFMPRWASRIILDVPTVRSQRVTEISAMDAVAEGIGRSNAPSVAARVICEINAFRDLWDSINTDRGFAWDDNHPVWIYDFEAK